MRTIESIIDDQDKVSNYGDEEGTVLYDREMVIKMAREYCKEVLTEVEQNLWEYTEIENPGTNKERWEWLLESLK